jgi:hypothetical protein
MTLIVFYFLVFGRKKNEKLKMGKKDPLEPFFVILKPSKL